MRAVDCAVGRVLLTFEPLQGWRSIRPFPALNLHETAGFYLLQAAVPGMLPEEIEVSLEGETLTLRGERRRPEGVADESYRRQERPFGRFSRTVTLPERIDEAGVTAHCVDGVLSVRLPKQQAAGPRQIHVAGTQAAGGRAEAAS
jgi:HSP20 family protein